MKPFGAISLAVMTALLFGACSSTGASVSGSDLSRLKAYWENDTGLYYLDMSGDGPVSFVLPNQAATLSKGAKGDIADDHLTFKDGQSEFRLLLGSLPSSGGNDRCFEIDSVRLCERPRP